MTDEKCPAWAENDKLRASLEGMCRQFAFWSSTGGHMTGGLSVLENAFDLLGWDDPHICPEAQCDEPGCKEQITCGTPTADGYRNTCWPHHPDPERRSNEG